jgi:hypothetical protein
MRLVLKDPQRFTYCEGFGMHGDFYGIPHAWAEDYDGLVVDPTWVRDERECEYVGLRFDFRFASELVFGSGRFGLGTEIPGTLTCILSDPHNALRADI